MTFIEAIATTKLINVFSSGIATVIFMRRGLVDYRLGAILGATIFVGALLGALFARRLGNLWIRRIHFAAVWLLGLETLLFDVLGSGTRLVKRPTAPSLAVATVTHGSFAQRVLDSAQAPALAPRRHISMRIRLKQSKKNVLNLTPHWPSSWSSHAGAQFSGRHLRPWLGVLHPYVAQCSHFPECRRIDGGGNLRGGCAADL
jgi:hypothetical protein